MKISIITVSYNSVKTIEDTIKSVLKQTYKNIEYILIDGGSTDGTLDVIGKFKNQHIVLISENDKGVYYAMNKGLSLATGDIIGFLNSDDIYENFNVLEDIISIFKNDTQIDILFTDLDYVDKNDINKTVRRWRSQSFYSQYFEHGNVPPHPTFFVRSYIYRNYGVFNTSFKFAADYELMFRFLKKQGIRSYYLSKVVVKMRLGGITNRSLLNILKGNLEILKAWKINHISPPFFLIFLRIYKKIIQFITR